MLLAKIHLQMWLEQNNLRCRVIRATNVETRWLGEYLSFSDPTARFRHAKDNKIHMFNSFRQEFAAGFLPILQKAAQAEGIQIEVFDKRTKPCEIDSNADLGWLRDYQKEAVRKCAPIGRGVLWLPTAAGKTEIVIGLTKILPCRWLMVAHRSILMDQAATRYETRTGLRAGRIGEGVWDDGGVECRLVSATFQTLYSALKRQDPKVQNLLSKIDGIIVDEVHTLPSETYYRVIMSMPNVYYRFGVSATPMARGDRKSIYIIAALGPVIHRVRSDVLIQAGYLAKPQIKMISCEQESDKPTFQGVYGDLIVRSKARNKIICEAAKRAEKPCLVFVKEVKHGKILRQELQKSGINCEFVWGTDHIDRRKNLIKWLETGKIDVLVCSVVFNEGVDIPCLRSVVIAAGGKSAIAALQRIGRGTRISEGKTTFDVYDVKDLGNRWLENHYKERQRSYMQEKYEITEIDIL